ncbi:hypothetical protein ACHAWF_007484 [Thalassiosira exigua]
MNASPLRSRLAQRVAATATATARAQQPRPRPGSGSGALSLFAFAGESSLFHNLYGDGAGRRARAAGSTDGRPPRPSPSATTATAPGRDAAPPSVVPRDGRRRFAPADDGVGVGDGEPSPDAPAEPPPEPAPPSPSPSALGFQHIVSSRRTASNFVLPPPSDRSADRARLSEAITRAVRCAVAAPNHKRAEPTTFHRILAPSPAWERLLDVAYHATLRRLRTNQRSGDEACRNEAARKREKWSSVPAFVVASARGVEERTAGADPTSSAEHDPYEELPYAPPSTTRHLEDYASACASVQNFLLSLHSEGWGTKWATGPVVRTRALRDLVGCGEDDAIVGLIMVGRPKRTPKTRRRREVEGGVLRDVEWDGS